LVQLRVVRAFREVGVPLQRVRSAAEVAGDLFGTSHPLAHLRLKTEGRGEISYQTETGLAERWYAAGPGGGVVLDPAIAFGTPVVVGANVPTRVIWDQSTVEPDVDRLAGWFRLDVRQVQDALRYEQRLARAA
jgi:uncharacterized protein (DUF433 family)